MGSQEINYAFIQNRIIPQVFGKSYFSNKQYVAPPPIRPLIVMFLSWPPRSTLWYLAWTWWGCGRWRTSQRDSLTRQGLQRAVLASCIQGRRGYGVEPSTIGDSMWVMADMHSTSADTFEPYCPCHECKEVFLWNIRTTHTIIRMHVINELV